MGILRIVTCLVTLQLMSAEDTGNSKCLQSELVPCGDHQGIYQWEFCTATAPNQRITHVHLDKRYRNRYCTKHNYGITTNHQRFWVHQWCFGTFIVCFVSEEDFKTQMMPVPDIDNRSGGSKHQVKSEDFYRISTQEPQSLAPDTSSSYPRQSAKAHTIKETDTTSKEPTGTGMSATVTTSELTSGVTYLTIAARVAKSNITVISDSLLPIQNTDRFPLQRITARVWIIMVLGAAGGLLLILIGVICFLIIKRCSNDDEVKERRFSEENTSTVHLVEPHTDKTREKSVYDFIPIDPDTGFPSVSNDNVSLCKHYFEVKTEVLSADATKLNIYDRASVGNEYDVLIRKSRPYRSMSETSNYSHLGDITCSVTAEENSRGHETIATNHVYAILVPCDSEHFHYIEEERNATYTTIRQAIP